MAIEPGLKRLLRLYPADCQPRALDEAPLGDGFSGAKLWQLDTPRGLLCLRRWPAGHPDIERLEFIQAVLWHVDQEGFHSVAVPLETTHRHGYVWFADHLWELTPWLPGVANYREHPSPLKLRAAMAALARFHRAAATFPLPEARAVPSPGLVERLARLESLLGDSCGALRGAIASGRRGVWPDLAERGARLLELFLAVAPRQLPALQAAAGLGVPLVPCIRDIWHAHVLFLGDEVSGIVDFGSMRPETVAGDVARLLGSLAMDHGPHWEAGLAAYQAQRALTGQELQLVTAFDRSTVLLGGIQWLQWIFVEGRDFANRQGVLARVDEFLLRLRHLAQIPG